VIHTRAADDDTLALLHDRADGMRVILHCFSMADRVQECLEHDQWWFSFAGNSTYPKAHDLRAAALRIPAERLLVETDAPYLSRSPCAAPRTSRQRGSHGAGSRGRAPGVIHGARADHRAERAAAFGW